MEEAKKKSFLIERSYEIGLVVLLLAFLLALEYFHPYFFLQDDNRDQYLPWYVHNYRSLLNGQIALYNFHQFLGAPQLAAGQTGVLYMPAYISVALSKILSGGYFLSIEILAIFHLVFGGLGFYLLLCLFGVDKKSSFIGGLTWSLASFNLYLSTSWLPFNYQTAYLPWILFTSVSFYKTLNSKHLGSLVILSALLFYVGYPQSFIYIILCEIFVISVIFFTDKDKIRLERRKTFIIRYLAGFIFTAVLSAPQLLPMWDQMSNSLYRHDAVSYLMFSVFPFDLQLMFSSLFNPYTSDLTRSVPGMIMKLTPHYLFIGYISIAFSAIFTVIFIKNRFLKNSVKKHISKNAKNEDCKNFFEHIFPIIFIIIATVSFLWATNIIGPLIYKIPILNRFRCPFKVGFFLQFSLIALSAFGLWEIVFKKISGKKNENAVFSILILITLASFGFLYFPNESRAFRVHYDKIPLSEPQKDKISDGRIFTLGYDINEKFTAPTLGFDYATLWGLSHFAGYDPFMLESNSKACFKIDYFCSVKKPIKKAMLDYLREWGVKYYIVSSNDKVHPDFLIKNGLEKFIEEPARTIYIDDQARPVIAWHPSNSAEGVSSKFNVNSIDISAKTPEDQILIVRCVYNPFFKCYIDGEASTIKANNLKHMCLKIPAGGHQIRLVYENPYFTAGCAIAGIFLIALIPLYYINHKKSNIEKVRKKKD